MVRQSTAEEHAMVHVVDDDPHFRSGLANLLAACGYRVATFETPQSFVETASRADAGCVILDIHLRGANGLDVQAGLPEQRIDMPVILMTGNADVPSSVRGMKAGAVDFLIKPFAEDVLLGAVNSALRRDVLRRERSKSVAGVRERYANLTDRERQVMALVVAGLMNKQVAGKVGLSEITVKVHRGALMRKMQVRTLADLVRAAETLKVSEVV